MQKATGEANANMGIGTQDMSAANTTANQWANIGSATAQAGAALAKNNSNSNNNTDNSSDTTDEESAD